ncbi:capsular polysaccharide export protein, LipB/KpsS family [Namhaeicola litoreus]|uniref:Capsule polysaccharide biosynthesis protein n=1 Tax=Namhaeicola litoreus TaxID=1052145 RepID=A0ABW3Y2K2_9FLAO
MDNVWYYKQSVKLEERIISEFKQQGKWNLVIWSDNEFYRSVHSSHERESFFKFSYKKMNNSVYNGIKPKLFKFIEMYSRWSKLGSFLPDNRTIYDYENIFNMMVNYTYHKLVDNKISLIIFNRAPHIGGDFILYELGQLLGIKTLIMEQSQFPNKFFYYFKNEDYGNFETSSNLREYNKIEIQSKFEKEIWYMNKKEISTFNIKNSLYKKFQDEYRLIKELFIYRTDKNAIERYFLKKKYKNNNNLYSVSSIDLKLKYVYFPLHLQPEKTTSIWGGVYVDQLLAVEKLRDILPEDWYIYIKENPKQNYYIRGNSFYERLRKINHTILIDKRFDTYNLMKNCQFVATVAGTAGWEAITGGKKTLVFGWGVWYKNLPGVFKFDEGFKLNDILDYNFEHNELEIALSKLMMKMAEGIIYLQYSRGYKDYDFEINIRTVYNSMYSILYNKNGEIN